MSTQKNSSRLVVIGVVVAVIVALLIAVIVGSGESSDSTDVPVVPGASDAPSGDVEQNRPVTVEGQALDRLGDSGADTSIGAPAPALLGANFDGSSVNVTPGEGGPYMVVFLAHWCPHCNAEIPRLIEWQQSGAVPSDLRVIGVSTGVASDRPNYPPSDWVVAKQWPWPVMADSEGQDAAIAYGVSGYPFFAIVGADGKIKVRASGEVEIDALNQIVTDALAD